MARDRRERVDEDDDRRRARKRERDDDRKDHRSDKKKKEKKAKKEHKRSHSHKKRDRDDDEAKGLPAGAPPISEADYFLRATEFRVWLARSKSKYVEELSTDESTALFRDSFCRKWNRGKLPREYYAGLPDALVEQTRRTRHQWGFVATLGDRERFDLATAKDSVDVATRKTDLLASATSSSAAAPTLPKESASHARERSPARDRDRREEEVEDDREERRRSWKRQRRDRASDLEELAPKETGREALIEKRRQVAQKMHGAARDREENRDGLDVSDEFLMGGKGDDGKDLERRLAQRGAARRQRDAERQERLAGLQAKESARMDKFLQDMGLAGAGKTRMTIVPRPPPSS